MKNSVSCRDDVTELLVELLNAQDIGMKCMFDELDTKQTSLCISTAGDNKSTESVADVCFGNWLKGTMTADIIYRIVSSSISARDEHEAIKYLDSLYDKLKRVYNTLAISGFYFTGIQLLNGARLGTTYTGGIKDFTLKFAVSYERKEK